MKFSCSCVSGLSFSFFCQIKKSIIAAEVTNTKNFVGQGVTNVKGNLAKAPVNIIGSPNFKAREVT